MPVPTNTRPPVRKALSIAAQYADLENQGLDLEGTHNDPHILSDLLVDVFGYRKDDITVLMDEKGGPYPWPTKENILSAMHALLDGAQPGDHYVFHFSGHGSLIPNKDGTEESGFDEVIWPVDIRYNGTEDDDDVENYIKDDDIHDILVNRVPVGAHFMMVFDCCHSGTMADLPNHEEARPPTPSSASTTSSTATLSASSVKNIRIRGSQDAQPTSDGLQHKTTKATFVPSVPLSQVPTEVVPPVPDVTSWSACEDNQVTLGGRKGGIFVNALAKALRSKPSETHHELLESITQEVANIVAKINKHKNPDEDAYQTPVPEMCALQPIEEVDAAPLVV